MVVDAVVNERAAFVPSLSSEFASSCSESASGWLLEERESAWSWWWPLPYMRLEVMKLCQMYTPVRRQLMRIHVCKWYSPDGDMAAVRRSSEHTMTSDMENIRKIAATVAYLMIHLTINESKIEYEMYIDTMHHIAAKKYSDERAVVNALNNIELSSV